MKCQKCGNGHLSREVSYVIVEGKMIIGEFYCKKCGWNDLVQYKGKSRY